MHYVVVLFNWTILYLHVRSSFAITYCSLERACENLHQCDFNKGRIVELVVHSDVTVFTNAAFTKLHVVLTRFMQLT
jgi:hypothetical protein